MGRHHTSGALFAWQRYVQRCKFRALAMARHILVAKRHWYKAILRPTLRAWSYCAARTNEHLRISALQDKLSQAQGRISRLTEEAAEATRSAAERTRAQQEALRIYHTQEQLAGWLLLQHRRASLHACISSWRTFANQRARLVKLLRRAETTRRKQRSLETLRVWADAVAHQQIQLERAATESKIASLEDRIQKHTEEELVCELHVQRCVRAARMRWRYSSLNACFASWHHWVANRSTNVTKATFARRGRDSSKVCRAFYIWIRFCAGNAMGRREAYRARRIDVAISRAKVDCVRMCFRVWCERSRRDALTWARVEVRMERRRATIRRAVFARWLSACQEWKYEGARESFNRADSLCQRQTRLGQALRDRLLWVVLTNVRDQTVREAFVEWKAFVCTELDQAAAASAALASSFAYWLEWISWFRWREDVIDRVGHATWERQRLLASGFRRWCELRLRARQESRLISTWQNSAQTDMLASALAKWVSCVASAAAAQRVLSRAIAKLARRKLFIVLSAWARCVALQIRCAKGREVAQAWSQRQIVSAAFVVWRENSRHKQLVASAADAEGERLALVESEALAQAALREKAEENLLLSTQLAEHNALMLQQEAESDQLHRALEATRALTRSLEGQLAALSQQSEAVAGALGERGDHAKQLRTAAVSMQRLKDENEELASQLTLHVASASELATRCDALEDALRTEQGLHANLHLERESLRGSPKRDLSSDDELFLSPSTKPEVQFRRIDGGRQAPKGLSLSPTR